MQSKNILVTAVNSATEYSGGRYHTWMMLEALAAQGYNVTIWTNNIPVFIHDFDGFPNHNEINIHLDAKFSNPPTKAFDMVIVVPRNNLDPLYFKSFLIAYKNRAKLALLNFETPNWFNMYSPEKREEFLWKGCVETSKISDLILSSTNESNTFAKKFYTKVRADTLFRYCYPSINSVVADRTDISQKDDQIIAITRFSKKHTHKGGYQLLNVIDKEISGMTLAIIVGSGTIEDSTREDFLKKANEHNVSIRFLSKLNDKDKFSEIKRSKLMIFLSYFEGFGYPPIEAQYCNVPCIVYDLPVLRETSGDGIIYVEKDNFDELKSKIQTLRNNNWYFKDSLKEDIKYVAQFEAYKNNLEHIIQEVFNKKEGNINSANALSLTYWQINLAFLNLLILFKALAKFILRNLKWAVYLNVLKI